MIRRLVWTASLLTAVSTVAFTSAVRAQQGVSETYATVRKSIALIMTAKRGRALASGTAFCVYSDNRHSIFATNRHVIEGADAVAVLVQSAKPVIARAGILRVGSVADLALLDVAHGGIPVLTFAASGPTEGTRVAVAGYPQTQMILARAQLGLTPSLHVGIVNALPANGVLIQFDAQVEHGNSGGPLFDAESGLVYGIVTWKMNGRESNLAIAAPTLMAIARNARVALSVEGIARVTVTHTGATHEPPRRTVSLARSAAAPRSAATPTALPSAPAATIESLPSAEPNNRSWTMAAPNAILQLTILTSSEEMERGLSGRASLPPHWGAIFVFSGDASRRFWTKNVPFAVDFVFIARDGTVTGISTLSGSPYGARDADVPSITGYGRYVIAIPGGEAVRDGFEHGMHIGTMPAVP